MRTRFSSRLKELLEQHEDGIEHFEVVGITSDRKEIYESGDVEAHLNSPFYTERLRGVVITPR